jgi:hypothetical protein
MSRPNSRASSFSNSVNWSPPPPMPGTPRFPTATLPSPSVIPQRPSDYSGYDSDGGYQASYTSGGRSQSRGPSRQNSMSARYNSASQPLHYNQPGTSASHLAMSNSRSQVPFPSQGGNPYGAPYIPTTHLPPVSPAASASNPYNYGYDHSRTRSYSGNAASSSFHPPGAPQMPTAHLPPVTPQRSATNPMDYGYGHSMSRSNSMHAASRSYHPPGAPLLDSRGNPYPPSRSAASRSHRRASMSAGSGQIPFPTQGGNPYGAPQMHTAQLPQVHGYPQPHPFGGSRSNSFSGHPVYPAAPMVHNVPLPSVHGYPSPQQPPRSRSNSYRPLSRSNSYGGNHLAHPAPGAPMMHTAPLPPTHAPPVTGPTPGAPMMHTAPLPPTHAHSVAGPSYQNQGPVHPPPSQARPTSRRLGWKNLFGSKKK